MTMTVDEAALTHLDNGRYEPSCGRRALGDKLSSWSTEVTCKACKDANSRRDTDDTVNTVLSMAMGTWPVKLFKF